MNKSDGKSLKAGIWYTASSFLVKSISFITMPIFTRILSKNEIGIFSVSTTWISILTAILSLNLYDTVILARYDYKDEKEYREYLSTITLLGTAVGLAFYIFMLFFQDFSVSITGMPLYAVHLVLIYIVLSPCTLIILSKYRTEMQYGKTVAISLLTTLSSAVVSIALVLLWEDKLKGRFYGTFIPGIFINLVLFAILVFEGKAFKLKYCKYALPLGLPLIIHYLSGNLMGFSDRIMIQRMCGNEEVAIYSIAYTCAMFVDILRNSLNSAWDPWVFERLNGNRTEDIQGYTKYYLLFFISLCIYVMLFAPELLLIFGGKAYLEAKYVIPPVVLGYIFCMIYSLFSCLERYAKQQKIFAVITFICAVANILLNFLLIPVFGYIAAAYTTLFSYILSSLLHFLNARKIGLAGIYDLKMILKIIGYSVLLSALVLFSYTSLLLRYGLISVLSLGILFFFIRKRDLMIGILKSVRAK